MKRTLLLAAIAWATVGCGSAVNRIENASSNAASGTEAPANEVMAQDLPEITFENDFHDFGEIQEGQRVEHLFTFENTGKGPLIIQSAQGSCGCTVPEWPRQPIAPGETGTIKVSFDSKNRAGRQDKNVTLTTNAIPKTKVLNITSTVISNN